MAVVGVGRDNFAAVDANRADIERVEIPYGELSALEINGVARLAQAVGVHKVDAAALGAPRLPHVRLVRQLVGAAVRQRELGAVERVDAAQDVAARVACFCVADVRRDLGELALVAGGQRHAHLQLRQPVGQVLANVGFHNFI